MKLFEVPPWVYLLGMAWLLIEALGKGFVGQMGRNLARRKPTVADV